MHCAAAAFPPRAGVLDYVQRARVLKEVGELVSGEHFSSDNAIAYRRRVSAAQRATPQKGGDYDPEEGTMRAYGLLDPAAMSDAAAAGASGARMRHRAMSLLLRDRFAPSIAKRRAFQSSLLALLCSMCVNAFFPAVKSSMVLAAFPHLHARAAELPNIDMRDTRTCYAWLAIRLVLLNYGVRMRNRAQEYITIVVITSLAFLVWQVVQATINHAQGTALDAMPFAFYEACILFPPCAMATCGVELWGARANALHRVHRVTLLKQRCGLFGGGAACCSVRAGVAAGPAH